ncbi:MAG: MmgE/PrpD family protein [Candidatus Dormibacteraeota bacterium]|uniref:MmgE/PrpD family protein n=2 Tax=Candidatus Dormibacteria TaxID=3126996 RepID=A0A934JZU6_9BACT|nr:MmgE/PrpD family protein [Candidatus Dormibacteraeota bacterium]MBJ7603943.1 MmgE/PrpD family protein [Candidatus Dormibacteraeota bacterium]MBJ7607178.1 MmgE/PrpD family protein [Candidatus Dormibacteraeota bacterium]
MTTTGVTRVLAGFAVDRVSVPELALEAGRRTMLNAIALAVGAARHAAVEAALTVLHQLGSPPLAAVLGRGDRLAPQWAALVNGIGVHVEDFDDTHLPTVIHPGPVVVPAALAVADWLDRTGEDVLLATVIGTEIALRIGMGLGDSHFDRGWHVTGISGPLGAAAAAGRLLRLDETAMANALGLAATQAAGLQESLGYMTKSLQPAKAAANGVEAALLAAEGFTSSPTAIEGRRGLGALVSAAADYARMLADLGRTWEIELNAFKPYACGIVSHPAIDAAITLRRRVKDVGDIAEVVVTVNPVVLDVMGKIEPSTGLQSKFSVYHSVAVGLVDGAAGPPQFSDARALAPDIVALRRKVRAITDASIAKDEARMRLRTATGDVHEVHIKHATGSAAQPMTEAGLRAKAERLAEPVLGRRTAAFIEAAWRVDRLPSARELISAATSA